MKRRAAAAMILLGSIGCGGGSQPPARTPAEAQFFTAESMHLSPVFTKVTDFDGDGNQDGIEAVVELQDRFGDPTKAVGRVVFQIYRYRAYNPDPRGERLAGPFEGRVDSAADQKARWSRVNRAYIFQLAYPNASKSGDYVVEAMFEASNGGRLFDRLTIEGDRETPAPTTGPSPINGTGSGAGNGPTGDAATPAAGPSAGPSPAGSITTQEYRRVPATSQPHEPPPRADQP
ncbi:MAG TPA: hypothetical protein VF595_05045 [Tepidisphaeraceae bacterium]